MLPFNHSSLSLNVTGMNTLVIVAWHAEFDAGFPDRIYDWLNPPAGANTIAVLNPSTTANEGAASVLLLTGISQSSPVALPVFEVSTSAGTGGKGVSTTTMTLSFMGLPMRFLQEGP